MWRARPAQKRVIPCMVRDNIILVWEPGVGKTYPVLSAAHYVDGPTLIVVPAHLRLQWLEQAQEHAPLLPAVILEGTTKKIPDEVFDNYDIFICSYEYASTLARWKQLRKQKWGALAIDECQYITNLDADRTRAMLGLKPEEKQGMVFAADVVWYLSGTPFTFPNQIYPILAASFPGAIRRTGKQPGLMTAREWENEFCVVADKGDGFGVKVVDVKNVPELRARLKPYLDKEKLDLGEITLTVDTIPIEGTLRDLTKGLDRETMLAYTAIMEILHDDDIPDMEKLAMLEEYGGTMAEIRHAIAATKVASTVKIVRNELFTGVKKLLVFGWHRKPLEALARELDAPIIYGGMSDRRKTEAKNEFLGPKGSPVLVGQISSIGTGTDGLQKVCHRSLFMEASWAYRENKQCLHRTFRTGQRYPCHSSFISLVGSIDEYVSRILKRNAEIVSRILDGE